jgi:hypothetical protein
MDDARKNKLVSFYELVEALREGHPGQVTVMSYESVKFARDCGIDCWHLAGSMTFQKVIHIHGSEEEKQRLRDLKVGYR